MKLRVRFISNSSSSSFILALETLPKTTLGMQRMLFEDKQSYYSGPSKYGDDDNEFWSTTDVAKKVKNDIDKYVSIQITNENWNKIADQLFTNFCEGLYSYIEEIEDKLPNSWPHRNDKE